MNRAWLIAVGLAAVLGVTEQAEGSVRWPGSLCDGIDPVSTRSLLHGGSGRLTNEGTWDSSQMQCPVRTPPGLASDAFVQWTGFFTYPMPTPCRLRITSAEGELLASTLVMPSGVDSPVPSAEHPIGFAGFEWQPSNAELYGVAETTAIVRCQLPSPLGLSNEQQAPGVGISQLTQPGDDDLAPHRWPGVMCKPMFRPYDTDHPDALTGADDYLYNSGGALANLSTAEWLSVVCPVPIAASRTQGQPVQIHVDFLTKGDKHCRLTAVTAAGLGDFAGTEWSWQVDAYSSNQLSFEGEIPNFEFAGPVSLALLCELPPSGVAGPDGIVAYTTAFD